MEKFVTARDYYKQERDKFQKKEEGPKPNRSRYGKTPKNAPRENDLKEIEEIAESIARQEEQLKSDEMQQEMYEMLQEVDQEVKSQHKDHAKRSSRKTHSSRSIEQKNEQKHEHGLDQRERSNGLPERKTASTERFVRVEKLPDLNLGQARELKMRASVHLVKRKRRWTNRERRTFRLYAKRHSKRFREYKRGGLTLKNKEERTSQRCRMSLPSTARQSYQVTTYCSKLICRYQCCS